MMNTDEVKEVNEIVPVQKPLKLKIITQQELIQYQYKKPIIDTFLMFDGTKKSIKDLQVGDELMGDDSKPCKILTIVPVNEENYIVEPIKGESYIVCQSDILSLYYSANPGVSWETRKEGYQVNWLDIKTFKEKSKGFYIKNYKGESDEIRKELAKRDAELYKNSIVPIKEFDMPVSTYLKLGKDYKRLIKGYKHEIIYPGQEFEIDPYIFGYWLGDGDSSGSGITTADPEILVHFTEYFKKFGLVVKESALYHYNITTGTNKGGYGRNKFKNFLKDWNLISNKHIPMTFLQSSKENRLKLLAGLIDSDGSLGNNCYDFLQKREGLLDDVVVLCRSLGFSCYKSAEEKTCTNSKNGPVTGLYYRICISGKGLEEIPVLLNRKRASVRRQIKNALVNGIELKKIGIFPTLKLFTDNPRFLMSDFTVRHTAI